MFTVNCNNSLTLNFQMLPHVKLFACLNITVLDGCKIQKLVYLNSEGDIQMCCRDMYIFIILCGNVIDSVFGMGLQCVQYNLYNCPL